MLCECKCAWALCEFVFLFFKQKTAYEMRISDWSSDVCSSDLLARLPDSPPGIKGLSTFVVPKYLVNADGSIGERNPVKCVSIEHKMGINGSCTCTMSFENARGWMIGKTKTGSKNRIGMSNQ